MSSASVSKTREFAPVWEKISQSIFRSSPSASAMPKPSAKAAVLMFMTMFTRALTWAARPASPTKRKLMLRSSNRSFTLSKTSCLPPIIK